MLHRTEASFPGGYNQDIKVLSPGSGIVWDFHTDYSKEYGGESNAPTPWDTFLAALTACQGIHVKNCLTEHNVPTDNLRVQVDLVVAEDNREVKEFITNIVFPKGISEEIKEQAIKAARCCKIVQHMLDFEPTVRYTEETAK